MNALLLVVLAQFPTDVFENQGAFEALEDRDGVKVSRREVKGSAYWENRVESATTFAVADLCEGIYEWGTRANDGPGIVLNKLLTDGEDLRVVYNQISKPVVANRDYVLTIIREHRDDGSCRIRFRTTNELAPPKPAGFVRMDKLWGEWILEPVAAGGSKVTYTLFSDPAGSVPAFLVHGAARDSTREALLVGFAKTRRLVEGRK